MSNELATRRMDAMSTAPAFSFSEMQLMAKTITDAGMFNIEQNNHAKALTLLMLAQAEGKHPIQAMREYHIIKGMPAMRADAMLAKFRQAGGRVKWIKSNDVECVATFFENASDQDGFTVEWTIDKAKQAQLSFKDFKGNPTAWSKFPAAMLRARCISEGVRAVLPEVIVGIYTPDEVENFAPTATPTPTPTPTRTKAQKRDAAPAEKPDVVEGEIIDTADSIAAANPEFFEAGEAAAAGRGFGTPGVFGRFLVDKLAAEGKKFAEYHDRQLHGIIAKMKRDAGRDDKGKPIENYDGGLFTAELTIIAEQKGGSSAGLIGRVDFDLSKRNLTRATADRKVRDEILKTIASGNWDAFIRYPESIYGPQAFNEFADAAKALGKSEPDIDAAWAKWCQSIGIAETDDVPADRQAALMKAVGARAFDWGSGTIGDAGAAAAA